MFYVPSVTITNGGGDGDGDDDGARVSKEEKKNRASLDVWCVVSRRVLCACIFVEGLREENIAMTYTGCHEHEHGHTADTCIVDDQATAYAGLSALQHVDERKLARTAGTIYQYVNRGMYMHTHIHTWVLASYYCPPSWNTKIPTHVYVRTHPFCTHINYIQ